MQNDDEKTPQLTLYSQRKWHHNGYVIGNRAGLEALRAAIDTALSAAPGTFLPVGLADAEPGDDEEYLAAVILEEDEELETAYWDQDAILDRVRGNSMVPNERYIMAVGVATAVRRGHVSIKE